MFTIDGKNTSPDELSCFAGNNKTVEICLMTEDTLVVTLLEEMVVLAERDVTLQVEVSSINWRITPDLLQIFAGDDCVEVRQESFGLVADHTRANDDDFMEEIVRL